MRRFWIHRPDAAETTKVVVGAALAGLAMAAIFSLWPQLDITVAKLFRMPDGSFLFSHSLFWQVLREIFLKCFVGWYILVSVGCALTWSRLRVLFRFGFREWMYLAVCSLAGPLLLVNIILKDHWGRWRPIEVIGLGGNEIFTPPLSASGTCPHNCSFVSGEVASMVMAFVALAFVSNGWRPVFYFLAIVMGLLEALIRMGLGHHFLSDTLFAGVFMVLVAAVLYWQFFLRHFETGRTNAGQSQTSATDLSPRHGAFRVALSQRGLALLHWLALRRQ